MYFFDYFESKIHEADINTIIFLLIKLIFDVLVTYALYSTMSGLIIGSIIFVVSILFAFSDSGEAVYRKKIGKNKFVNNKRLNNLLNKAIYINDVNINYEKIDFYLVNSDKNFMYATSRHSICFTNKFLENSDNEILTQMLRELKHIKDFNTDDVLYVGVGDLYIDIISLVIRVLFAILSLFMKIIDIIINLIYKDKKSNLSKITKISGEKFSFLIKNTWSSLGILLLIKNNRRKEFESDKMVCELGYRNELISLIDKGCYKNNLKILESNMKNQNLRIKKIDNY